MRTAVIIPTLNEQERVGHAIRSAWKSGANQVIVVDGGSSDNTVCVAHRAHAEVLDSLPGRATQMNLGAQHSAADVLVFLHADSRLANDCIQQICSLLATNQRAWGGAFRQRIAVRGIPYRMLEVGNAWRVKCLGIAFGDQGLFVRRSVFDQVQGFPCEPFLEDLILSRRLRRIARPTLLAGPLWTSARRWQRNGVVRQSLLNWSIQLAYGAGITPTKLAAWYQGK